MPSHALAEPRRVSARAALEKLERVVILGDLSSLTNEERIAYYARVCESLGLNPLTRPFDYLNLKDRGLILYARKDATDQLRKVNAISVTGITRESDVNLGLQIVTVEGRDRTGRTDSSIGVVSTKGLSGELLANALMKAESKAKRRMTLSLAGLGWLDESEIEDVVEPPRESKGLLEAIQDRTRQLADVKPNETPTYTGGPILEPDEIPGADNEDGLPDIPQPDEREGQVGLATGATTPEPDTTKVTA